ncbi:MAG: FAD-dependent oxidoreductase [Chlamydiota bacterium]
MKKIAVVGGGFSGLALCYHLLARGKNVTLFDGKGIGGGASGIASGLLHPYPGQSTRLSWRGKEGMEATKRLLKLVGGDVYKESGILKIAVTPKREKVLRKLANRYEDIEWWDADRCRDFIQGIRYLPGIFIKSGITVHALLYSKRLWEVCESLGCRLEQRQVFLDDLETFDVVVLAVGGGIRRFAVREKLDLKFNKGQILVCRKPRHFENDGSLIGKGYLALSEDKDRCYLGATYERDFETEEPCPATATGLIFKQIRQFIPSHQSFKVEQCLAQIRVVSSAGYRPVVEKLDDRLYVITAMGSRGLLYHALLGKELAEEIAR